MNGLRCRPALAGALAVIALALTGCGGGTSGSDSAPAVAPAERREPAADGSAAGGAEAQDQAKVPAAPTATGGPAGTGVQQARRAIVYTGALRVRVKSVAAAADKAKRIVADAGGRLDNERATSTDGQDTATLVFKIPPGRYQSVTDRLGKEIGTRLSVELGTEDVTEQIADVDSRVKSAEAGLEQLRALLKKAKSVSDVLKIERELSGREADLEALQARQRSLASRTADGTLTLDIEGVPGPDPALNAPAPERPNFLSGLRTGWDALTETGRVSLAIFGALLPWLVVAGLLGAAFVAVRRLLRGLLPGRRPAAVRSPAPVPGPAGRARADAPPFGPEPSPDAGPIPWREEEEAATSHDAPAAPGEVAGGWFGPAAPGDPAHGLPEDADRLTGPTSPMEPGAPRPAQAAEPAEPSERTEPGDPGDHRRPGPSRNPDGP
ncbi:hypothetical protein Sme01_08050 [Sphaerisporangium melleum]|uniref:DUF4349 domain-containing protein n=1 Tax=Sphaerisporangium melleum TaxID=321316 RepID=A0A917QWE4_9ACTN|nr:DUF4349 domain-containing protein [Sphaerisporangium melleum]GGK72532.1 hypothetical protein GCM10007964_14140 [Sphaerisporangium melleum]GII68329.1 hypothetical protein Sme01_08050 [Sphaerisporangium melleum]